MAKKGTAGKKRSSLEEEPLLQEPSSVSASSSQGTPQRPQSSPYAGTFVALHIGPEERVYYVPQCFLQNPEWIDSVSCVENIHLPDVDENTGHVLVHYLYSGAYQTLKNIDASPIDRANIEFKRAVLAYVAAEKYKLQDLQQLAKHQIEHLGAEMQIFDIIDAIKEDFSKLPDGTAWFNDYLVGKAKTAFEEDHTVFAKDDFFDRINDSALGRLLVKCVVGLYNDKVSRMLSIEEVPVLRTSEECIPDAQDSIIEEVPVEECFTIEETPAEAIATESLPKPDQGKDEETVYSCPSPGKKVKKNKKKWSAAITQEAQAEPEPGLEQAVEAEDNICPDRARHLLEGDTWKDCRLCRAVLRQVAIQIARKHHIDEDGYEIVDQTLMG